ncbi:TatD family hydrolase [Candidatus Peregrinibacteria bacterium]|nr:TatD family hydrolase [Candidatus Peregrinibacteria bacterium]
MYIDVHAHLGFSQFQNDFNFVIQRLFEANIKKIINVGVDLESSRLYADWAKRYDFMYASIGIHPTESVHANDGDIEVLRSILQDSQKIVAIGEVGLDYYRAYESKKLQTVFFRKQLALAREFKKPVIIHCRDAYLDVYEILQEEGISKALFHCYSGSLDFAQKAWESGYFLSFTGIITYPNALNLRTVVREVPLDRFMIETDCPFLAPQKYRGKRNEPAFLPEIAAQIAQEKNMPLEEVAAFAFENSCRFFALS